MCNSLFIGKDTIPDAEDGDEVEIKVKGVYHTDPDGVRKLDILSADGKDVVDPDEAESDCGCGGDHSEEPMNQDAEDALRIFILKKKK
jgi:hypothetical protein